MTHASEAGHWYDRDGNPVYEVPSKTGGMRPTTLADARKLNLAPSVTGIIRMMSAPGLEYWKQQQVLHAALTLPIIEGESEPDYLARIMADSAEQARKAAERGTEIHAALQAACEDKPYALEYRDHVKGAMNAVRLLCGQQDWIAEASFTHPMGYGGKVDLHSDEWVVDFKTKEFGPGMVPSDKLETYKEHWCQLAAYERGLRRGPTRYRRCAIGFVSTTTPGLCRMIEITAPQLDRGLEMFDACLTLWRCDRDYYPTF